MTARGFGEHLATIITDCIFSGLQQIERKAQGVPIDPLSHHSFSVHQCTSQSTTFVRTDGH